MRDRNALLGIALVSLLAYANTLPIAELVSDDLELIPEHAAIRSPWDAPKILTSGYWGPDDYLYRPWTLWSFALNHRANALLGLPGAHPPGYHLVNLLLHLGVGGLLYLFLRSLRCPPWPRLAAALLFAVHPLHTEAVAMIVGRAELLAALFGILFLLLHRLRRAAPAAALCYLLAIGSKESAVAFLPLAIWMDRCLRERDQRPRWRTYGLYGLTLLGWLGLRASVLSDRPEGIPPIDNPLVQASLIERWLTACRVQLDYLRLQLAPFGLSSDYSYDQIPAVSSPLDPRFLSFVALVVTAAWLAWRLRRSHPLVPFAVGGYALLFAPTANLLFPIGTIMGERLAYSPSLLVCALLGYGVWQLRAVRGRTGAALLAIVLLICGALTVRRNATWSDMERYVRAQVSAAPSSAKAHYNMAVLHSEAGRSAASIESARRAIAIFPRYAEAWDRLGLALAETGDLPAAIEAHLRSTAIFPGYAGAWGHLGDAQLEAGRTDAGLDSYARAVELDPRSAGLRYRLGVAHQRLGQPELAEAAYRAAIELRPEFAPPYSNLGAIYAASGRYAEAAELFTKALEIDPDYAPARANLDRLRQRR